LISSGSYWVQFILFVDWAWHITNFLNTGYKWDSNINVSRIFKQVDISIRSYSVFDKMPRQVADDYRKKYDEVKKRMLED